MTTELILLLSLYASIILASLLGESGPVQIFSTAGPKLAAKIERNLATGYQFTNQSDQTKIPTWQQPQ